MTNTPPPSTEYLKDILGTYLLVGINEPYRLATYARRSRTHLPAIEKISFFKDELRYAIEHPGFITPELYEKWTNDDRFFFVGPEGAQRAATPEEGQAMLQAHLEEVWDACFGTEGTKILIKDILQNCLKLNHISLDQFAQSCRNAKSGPPLELAEFFKGELRYALDHPGFITPALFESWTFQSVPDQTTVQQRLQEVWDQCFG